MKQSDLSHNLWKRAPLWRLSLIGGISFLAAAFIFPDSLLLTLFPTLKPHYPPKVPPPPSAASDNTSLPERALSRGQQAFSFEVHPADNNQKFSGIISFAGHDFPLPPGTWHPLLTASSGNDLSMISLLREREGKVTGFLTLLASLRPIPAFMIDHLEEVKAKCHDDRIAAHWNAPSYRETKVNCAFLEPVSPLIDQNIANDPFLHASLTRAVGELAFEFPSIMLSKEWLKLKKIPGKGRIFENVTFWEAPNPPSPNAPPDPTRWNRFFQKRCQELPLWADKLSKTFDRENNTPPVELPRTLTAPLPPKQKTVAT